MACKLPEHVKDEVPDSVSIFEKCTDKIHNNIRVQYHPAPDNVVEKFVVCGKSFYSKDDVSLRLAEWIEALLAFGAKKVYFSIGEVHPNILKVRIFLDYFFFTVALLKGSKVL